MNIYDAEPKKSLSDSMTQDQYVFHTYAKKDDNPSRTISFSTFVLGLVILIV